MTLSFSHIEPLPFGTDEKYFNIFKASYENNILNFLIILKALTNNNILIKYALKINKMT